MKSKTFILFAAMLLVSAAALNAQVPELIHYQGRLVDGTNLVNGTVMLEMRLYDAPSGGRLLYTDTNPSVTVIDGLYDTHIGSNPTSGSLTDALRFPQVWLEVSVNGTPLLPRERLVAVPYAMKAGSVEAGSIGTEQLANPYQAGRVPFHDLGVVGPSFMEPEPLWEEFELPFNPPFAQIPSLSPSLQLSDPILFGAADIQTLSVGLSNATVRVAFPRVHQNTGMGLTPMGATIVDGRPAKISTVSTQVMYQIAADPAGEQWNAPVPALISTVSLSTAHASIAVINGHPAVAVAMGGTFAPGVFYARANDAAGTTWGAPVQISSNQTRFVNLAEINGRPAVAFETNVISLDPNTTPHSNLVWYAVAGDTTGDTWNAPLIVDIEESTDFAGSVNATPRLVMADSLPAVIYMRGDVFEGPYSLRIRRANNIHGTSTWGDDIEVRTLFLDGDWGVVPFAVAEVAGHPAVVMAAPNDEVQFMRAFNAQGSQWQNFVAAAFIEMPTSGIGKLSLNIVDGRPALAAIGGSGSSAPGGGAPNRLICIHALDELGQSWPVPDPDLTNLANPQIPLRLPGGPGRVVVVEADGEPAVFYSNRFLRSTQLPEGAMHWMAVQP